MGGLQPLSHCHCGSTALVLGWQPQTADRLYSFGPAGATSTYLGRSKNVVFVDCLGEYRRLNRASHGYKGVTLLW